MATATAISGPRELTISGLIVILKRRRTVLGFTTLVCVLLAALLCVVMTRRYEATARIQVDRGSSGDLDLSDVKSRDTMGSDALEDNISMQTQASILQSDTLALRVIRNLKLENTKDFQPRFRALTWVMDLFSPSGTKDPANASLDESPTRRTRDLQIFERHLKVKPLAGTRIIEISFQSSNPQVAAAVVNQLTSNLIDFTFESRNEAMNQGSHWLWQQVNDLKKQAEDSQAKVIQLQRDAGVYSLGASDNSGKEVSYSANLDRLQQATEALSQATANRIVKGGIYQMVKSGDPETVGGLAGSSLSGASTAVNSSFSLLQNLRAQQATIETRLAADSSKYGSANPKLEDEKASLAAITATINQEIKRIGERAGNDYKAAQIMEANMMNDYRNQRAAADQLNDKAIEYSIAKQEATDSRNLYETLLQHLKEVGVMEGLRTSNITVVDPGRTPSKPVRPNVPVYMAASLFGGLFLGSLVAFFMESIDDRVQSMEMIEERLRTPLLAVIPSASLLSRQQNKALPDRKPPRLLTSSSIVNPSGEPLRVPDASNTAFSEALRSLRTALLLSRSAAPPKVILVTSAAEGEGKSTISLHLAAALARNHSRVLLVEADMRCPGLSNRLWIRHARGLSNLLSGSDENLERVPFAELPNLSLIAAGPTPPYPSELLGSARMKDLVAGWSKRFDFVLIDSPSVLAVTDAAVLSKVADFTLLVARHAESTKKSLERAYNILRLDPENKVGVVLNAVDRGSSAYMEYFGYQKTGYYGTEKERARA
ncbi:MAG TPA: polysaccharide biosynthesis tyrosine autokinase [Terracidiphilus sp.]|nr:polysaccharide biosynthesis tyrosine autokinase [Terracidiphilus sp.]